MKRGHRLAREAHRRRKERAPQASHPGTYDAFAEVHACDKLLRSLWADGSIDLAALNPGTLRLILASFDRVAPALAPGGLADDVGGRVAVATFANRARGTGGRPVLGGSDRPVAEGCAALARAAILDRVVRAVGEVLRRRALVDHSRQPSWPEGYLERRAAAQEAEERAAGRSPCPTSKTSSASVLDSSRAGRRP